MEWVDSPFTISWLRNCHYFLLINPLRKFKLLCIRQMKATVVSYKVDADRNLMLQRRRKSAIGNDRPKITHRKFNNSHLDVFTFIVQKGRENIQFSSLDQVDPTIGAMNSTLCVMSHHSTLILKSLTPFLRSYCNRSCTVSTMIGKGAAQQLEAVPLSHDSLKNKHMMLPSKLRSIILQARAEIYSVPSGEWILSSNHTPSFTIARKRKLNRPCLWWFPEKKV